MGFKFVNEEELESDNSNYNFSYNNESLDEIIDFDEQQSSHSNSVMSEAIERIEQASLYQTLINHSLFSPNSARPEIMSLVESEIKLFALERLEILLGMKKDSGKNQSNDSSVFTVDEVEALKAIAGRLSQKQSAPTERSPGLNTIKQQSQQPLPVIKHIESNNTAERKAALQNAQVANQTTAKNRGRKKNSSESKIVPGKDYSQAINPANPPLPMPKDIHMSLPQNFSSVGGGGDVHSLMTGAIAEAMVRNKNVED